MLRCRIRLRPEVRGAHRDADAVADAVEERDACRHVTRAMKKRADALGDKGCCLPRASADLRFPNDARALHASQPSYQMAACCPAGRSIGSPGLHPHAFANSGMFANGPLTRQ